MALIYRSRTDPALNAELWTTLTDIFLFVTTVTAVLNHFNWPQLKLNEMVHIAKNCKVFKFKGQTLAFRVLMTSWYSQLLL